MKKHKTPIPKSNKIKVFKDTGVFYCLVDGKRYYISWIEEENIWRYQRPGYKETIDFKKMNKSLAEKAFACIHETRVGLTTYIDLDLITGELPARSVPKVKKKSLSELTIDDIKMLFKQSSFADDSYQYAIRGYINPTEE